LPVASNASTRVKFVVGLYGAGKVKLVSNPVFVTVLTSDRLAAVVPERTFQLFTCVAPFQDMKTTLLWIAISGEVVGLVVKFALYDLYPSTSEPDGEVWNWLTIVPVGENSAKSGMSP